jgi:DNA-binding SARP family transcriptional activator
VQRAIAFASEGKAQDDADLAIAYFRAALDLVEGEPLANALSGYSWWEAEGHGGRIAAVLVDAACTMAALACDGGNFELARWGLERARMVEPYSEALSRAAMQLAAAEGDADRLRLEWRECQRRVDALDPGSSPSPRTESLYGELSRRVLVGAIVPDAPGPRYPPTTND